MTTTIFALTPAMFEEQERVLVSHGGLTASAFRYYTGVAGLRITNELGELIILPFQGQQVWSAAFRGRNFTMKSMFDAPRPTRNYLETYGAFNIHCGFMSMGVPAAGDNHPLHGELPNAPYTNAWIEAGTDEQGDYLAVGGEYQHTVSFTCNYKAEPVVKLHANTSLFTVSMTITNLRHVPMEYMYMAHVNYRPVDNSRLVYSAQCTPEHVRVRRSIPSHVRPPAGYVELLDELARNPKVHNVLDPKLQYDPEIVFFIDYLADAEGWAHTMQVHPDGTADYIRHRPEQLDKGVRWICRTPDQDALGMVLPATAEPEGYTAEKAKGNVKVLPGLGVFRCDLECGVLTESETKAMEQQVAKIVA